MPRPAVIPVADLVHARRWVVLAILSGSLLLIAMDTTILNVAFPRWLPISGRAPWNSCGSSTSTRSSCPGCW